jgi:hypothetical protein
VNLSPIEKTSENYDFKIDTAIKRFVMVNYQSLSSDLARGNGMFLDGLLAIFGSSRIDRATLTESLRSLLIELPEIPTFGESVAAFYFRSRVPS